MASYDFPSPSSSSTFGRHDGFPIPNLIEPDYQSDVQLTSDGAVGASSVATMKAVQVPSHPIISMQGAFAESMLDASRATTPIFPRTPRGNAAERRKKLLDQQISEETYASRWRRCPGQQYHELWKLTAQISFGVYLLLNSIAKDNEQVKAILQGHMHEVDEFLETTVQDFDLAIYDINERLKFLKLPFDNIAIFDAMLEDRDFRLQIVTGNERIEHVITRTAAAMNEALKDVKQGLDACRDFRAYLAKEKGDGAWMEDRPQLERTFRTMYGNAQAWYTTFISLQTKGNQLGVSLVQLGSIVAEMDKRAGAVSRRTRFSNSPAPAVAAAATAKATTAPTAIASPPPSPKLQARMLRQSMAKNLPSDPAMVTPAIKATLPAFQLVQDRERSPEGELQCQAAEIEPEPLFILKPHTYSPVPSPAPSPRPAESPPKQQPQPEVRRKTLQKKRFSLKRKESPTEIALTPSPELENQHWGPRRRINSITAPQEGFSPLSTPPSRGVDSAYCSDLEKPLSPPESESSRRQASLSLNTSRNPPPILTRDFVPSPRSDMQFFRPVKASPNSPLQRPWTAGPLNRESPGLHTPTASQHGDRRGAPSTMAMSMVSDMTTATENGKKVKKKRSAFGWFKKAFSLSDEEKAAFEEKKRKPAAGYADTYAQRRPPRFLDGRRIQ